LAQEVREKRAAGDIDGALQALRRLDDASWALQGELRRQRGATGAGGLLRQTAPEAAAVREPSGLTNLLTRPGGQPGQSSLQPTDPTGRNAALGTFGTTRTTPSGPGGDVEGRLREVESKLDRLLKALEGPKPNNPADRRQ
jgi:hypothetical protein